MIQIMVPTTGCGYIIVIPSYSEANPSGPYGSATDATYVEVGGNWSDKWDWTDDWGIIHLKKKLLHRILYSNMSRR